MWSRVGGSQVSKCAGAWKGDEQRHGSDKSREPDAALRMNWRSHEGADSGHRRSPPIESNVPSPKSNVEISKVGLWAFDCPTCLYARDCSRDILSLSLAHPLLC